MMMMMMKRLLNVYDNQVQNIAAKTVCYLSHSNAYRKQLLEEGCFDAAIAAFSSSDDDNFKNWLLDAFISFAHDCLTFIFYFLIYKFNINIILSYIHTAECNSIMKKKIAFSVLINELTKKGEFKDKITQLRDFFPAKTE